MLRRMLALALAAALAPAASAQTVVIDPANPITIDNTGGSAGDPLAASAVSFQGGALTVFRFDEGPTTLTAGAAATPTGQSLIDLFSNPDAPTTFTFASLSGGGTGTVVFIGGVLNGLGESGPGANVANVFFTAAPTLVGGGLAGTPQVGIVPNFLVAGAASGDAYTFATYGTNGVRALDAVTEFTGTIAGAGATDNVRLTANETVSASAAVNSLVVAGDGLGVGIDAAQTLTITSGGLIALPGGTGSQVSGLGTLAFGPGGSATAFVTVDGGTLNVSTPVQSAGLVKSGGGVLSLASTVTLGAVSVAVNAGTLQVLGSDTLKSSTVVRVEGGAVLEVVGGTYLATGTGTLAGAGTLAFVSSGAGTIQVDAGTLTVSTVIDSAGLVTTGAGALTLAASATVGAGDITVAAGTLTAGTASLANAQNLIVRNGAILDLSGVAGGYDLGTGRTLTGAGTVSGTVNLGGTLDATSATGTPATLTVSSLALQSGGRLVFRIADGTPFAGTNQGLVFGTGDLDLSGLSQTNRVTIALTTVNGSGSAATAANFDATQSYTWTVASYGGVTGGFAANKFVVDGSQFLNATSGGTFAVGVSGGNLQVSFTPVPEPATVGLAAAAGLGMAGWVRRRRTRAS